jgi:hypothetical protein
MARTGTITGSAVAAKAKQKDRKVRIMSRAII